MRRLSMNEISTYRWSLEEDVENYQEAGFNTMGVWLQKLFDYGEEDAIDLIRSSQLQVSNVVWSGGFTGSDGRSVTDSINDSIHALRISAALEAGCLVVYAGGRNNHILRHANRLLRDAIDELLPIAEAVEVPLAIEPMHPACAADWTFLTDLPKTLAIVEDYSSPFLKIAYDTYHFPNIDRDRELFTRLIPHLGMIHLGDRSQPACVDQDRCLLGSGCVPLERTIRQAIKLGYEGDFDVKLMGQEIEVTCYHDILESSRSHFAQALGLLQQA